MKLALVLHIAAVIAARPKIASNIRTVAGPVIGVGGAAVLLIALQPDLGTDLVICATLGDDARRRRAADAPARARRRASGPSLVMLFALFEPYRRARLTSFLDPWDHAVRRGLPGGPGPDRDRLRRPLRPRPRRVDPEDLLRSRGPHGLHPRGHRGGARPGGHPRPAVAVRHHRVRRAADRQEGQGHLRQAPRRRPHLPDPVPSPAQRLRRPRPRAADRRPAAVHLVGLDVADRAARGDGPAAQRRVGRLGAPARRAEVRPRPKAERDRAAEDRDRGRRDGGPRRTGDRGRRRAAS